MSIKPLECAVFEIAQAYDGLYTHQARYNASDTGTSVLCVYVYVALRCQVSLAMPHARHWPAGVTADTVPPPPPEDAVRHGSITLANAVLPQRIRSAIADTIQL